MVFKAVETAQIIAVTLRGAVLSSPVADRVCSNGRCRRGWGPPFLPGASLGAFVSLGRYCRAARKR